MRRVPHPSQRLQDIWLSDLVIASKRRGPGISRVLASLMHGATVSLLILSLTKSKKNVGKNKHIASNLVKLFGRYHVINQIFDVCHRCRSILFTQFTLPNSNNRPATRFKQSRYFLVVLHIF